MRLEDLSEYEGSEQPTQKAFREALRREVIPHGENSLNESVSPGDAASLDHPDGRLRVIS